MLIFFCGKKELCDGGRAMGYNKLVSPHRPTAIPVSSVIMTRSATRSEDGPRWGITDSFVTSFLHFSLFSSALWNLASSRSVHFLMLSSHLFVCLPCHRFTVPWSHHKLILSYIYCFSYRTKKTNIEGKKATAINQARTKPWCTSSCTI